MLPAHLSRRLLGLLGRLLGVAVAVVVLAGACSSGEVPEVPEGADGSRDPVLVEGREVWSDNCTRCHGESGGGGSGPKLSEGRAEENFPEMADMVAVITNGRNAMPAWGGSLSEDQIEAVARYVREVL